MAEDWFLLPMVIFFGLCQATISDSLKIFNTKPDLLLICAVIPALFAFETRRVICLSAFSGILKDILGAHAIGINILIFPVSSFLVIELSKKITIYNNFIRVAVVFVVAVLNAIAVRMMLVFLHTPITGGALLRVIFLEPIYTAFISFLLLAGSKRIKLFKAANELI